MYGKLALIEMGFSIVLFLAAWYAVREAVRLRWSGTAERLHRKSRRLLIRTGHLTLISLVIFCSIAAMVASLPEDYWKDRLFLNAPLIGAPLLAIWFTTTPMLWRLWRRTAKTDGVLDEATKQYLGSRLFVLPYQATAVGALTSFCFTLVSPVPYDKITAALLLISYALVMINLWLKHNRRHAAHLGGWLSDKASREQTDQEQMPLSEESGTRV